MMDVLIEHAIYVEFIENDKRIYLIRKQNGGVSSARNLGLKKRMVIMFVL